MGVFKEAKAAYRERKAEIIAEREADLQEERARKALEAMTIRDETRSQYSERSRHSRSHSHHSSRRDRPELTVRPPTERYHSSSSVRSTGSRTSSRHSASASPRHSSRHSHHTSRSITSSPPHPETSLARRHTTQEMALIPPPQRRPLKRSSSTSAIDMDLAYGPYHPKSIQKYDDPETSADLPNLVSRAKGILEEVDCAHASVTAIISHLQKNPEAMAAVALTLAEISNIVTKMAPGALSAIKASSPAVFALLASPQFLIAAGVGVGITVVMLGGYKIIKKIKAKQPIAFEASTGSQEESMDEMVEIGGDIDRIENWRRGIVTAELESAAMGSGHSTIVDGEFITPMAAEMRRATTDAAGPRALPPAVPSRMSSARNRFMDDLKWRKSSSSSSKGKTGGSSSSSKGRRKDRSERAGRGSTASASGEGREVKTAKVKKPSPLKMMFQ